MVLGSPTMVYILRDLIFHVSPAMCYLLSIPMCPAFPFYMYPLAMTLDLYNKTPHKLIIALPHLTIPMLVLPSVSIGHYFIWVPSALLAFIRQCLQRRFWLWKGSDVIPAFSCASIFAHIQYIQYHQTALLPLLDPTWHMLISQYLADVSWFVTFLFKPHFPCSHCPPLVESPPMICACMSQYCTNSPDSFCYWLVTILHI